jgi:hypothetical protein
MLLDFRQNVLKERRRRSVDLDPRVAAVCAAMPYVNVEYFEVGAETNNEVENFRKNERVNDVARDFDDAARHSEPPSIALILTPAVE